MSVDGITPPSVIAIQALTAKYPERSVIKAWAPVTSPHANMRIGIPNKHTCQ